MRWVLVIVLGWTPACERMVEHVDFERMREQVRLDPGDPDPRFPDGRTARRAPIGTVPRERELATTATDRGRLEGHVDGAELSAIPVRIDRAVLERGRDRYERICGACHGVLGTGNPAIVANARLRPPPSLHESRIAAQPPGRVFRTITAGFGLMPALASHLSVDDRWAVIAYLRALRRSQRALLAGLSPSMRAVAEAALRSPVEASR